MRAQVGPPLIKLEVEHMRHAMVHAFSEYMLDMDGSFKEAIEKVCTAENVQAIVDEAAARHLKATLEEEVRNFFEYGEGRKVVANAVRKKLMEEIT